MDRQNKHYRQVKLLVQTLPHIAKVQQFALKGGTALNLFIHDLPRLSVDIDLTYIPVNQRETALKEIKDSLSKIASDIELNKARIDPRNRARVATHRTAVMPGSRSARSLGRNSLIATSRVRWLSQAR